MYVDISAYMCSMCAEHLGIHIRMNSSIFSESVLFAVYFFNQSLFCLHMYILCTCYLIRGMLKQHISQIPQLLLLHLMCPSGS